MIIRKSAAELETMREAGRVTARALRAVGSSVAPGVSTEELDALAEELIRAEGALAAFKGYHGFPASICASIDDEVVHGIPGKRRLEPGPVISIDVGAIVDGYYGDAAATFAVGEPTELASRLIEATRGALAAGIAKCVPGMRLGDVSHAVQQVAEGAGFSVVREYVGHGIGRSMHEEPQVPNFGEAGKGPTLKPDMVLAIEPMVNAGGHAVRSLEDGWTVVTADGSLSAHFEHTVAVTEAGPRLLTEE